MPTGHCVHICLFMTAVLIKHSFPNLLGPNSLSHAATQVACRGAACCLRHHDSHKQLWRRPTGVHAVHSRGVLSVAPTMPADSSLILC